jgi:hypothetical protein
MAVKHPGSGIVGEHVKRHHASGSDSAKRDLTIGGPLI